jgi:hypothetical protein
MAISEIYSRLPNEPYFRDDKIEINDELEALLGKIRMIMFTRQGDVLGNPEFGVDLEKYIFETFFDENSIINEVRNQFSLFIPEAAKYNLNVLVNLAKGEYKDQIIIDILINQERVLGFVI